MNTAVSGITRPSTVSNNRLLAPGGVEQEDEQRLREAVLKRGGVRLRGHDSADGEEVGTWLRISKQFRKRSSRNFGCRHSAKSLQEQ